jgi:uncharacterized protein YecE (DUF72 family)
MTKQYIFKDIHHRINFGTASDRYASWFGQIYNKDYKISSRTKSLGKQKFKEEVLEIKCVEEYFDHFNFLEIDFTFYNTLFNEKDEPTNIYHTLNQYNRYIPDDGKVIIKVPQLICARKTYQREEGKRVFKKNEFYHNTDLFKNQFYEPVCTLLGKKILAFIFEYEYQRKNDCPTPEMNIMDQQQFFENIPTDDRYHIEERTDRLKTPAYFQYLMDRNIGNVFSHWTYLPNLATQIKQAGEFTSQDVIIRLLTPLAMNYKQTYIRYQPFKKLVDELPKMYEDTLNLIIQAIQHETDVYVVANNRAGGNAPKIAQKIADLLERKLKR